jgi:hypothetical protein
MVSTAFIRCASEILRTRRAGTRARSPRPATTREGPGLAPPRKRPPSGKMISILAKPLPGMSMVEDKAPVGRRRSRDQIRGDTMLTRKTLTAFSVQPDDQRA